MTQEKQINRWCEAGIINPEQAEMLKRDIKQQAEDSYRKKMLAVIFTIGGLLVAIGGFLFVAANSWIWAIFNLGALKVGGLSLLTFGLYYLGYHLKYEKKSFPKLGETFILIASLLIGATYFLIVQTYNLGITNDLTLLAWLLSMLPLVYIYRLKTLTVISCCLFIAWQLTPESSRSCFEFDDVSQFLVYGLFFYSFGSGHTLVPKFSEMGLTYKNTGLFFIINNLLGFSLFYLWQFIDHYDHRPIYINFSDELQQIIVQSPILLVISFVLSAFYFYKQFERKQLVKVEVVLTSFIILSILILKYNLIGSFIGVALWFSMVFCTLVFGFFYLGFKRGNLVAVNLATTYLMLFLISIYIMFAFRNMSLGASIFMMGGLLLMGIGWFIEKKRRELTKVMINNKQVMAEVPSKEEEEAQP